MRTKQRFMLCPDRNLRLKEFLIDSTRFDSLDGFYVHADEVLCDAFTSGRNLDAFRDILLGGFGAFDYEERIGITWKGSAKSQIDLGYPETVVAMKKRLLRCHPSNRATVAGYLADAESGKGPTA